MAITLLAVSSLAITIKQVQESDFVEPEFDFREEYVPPAEQLPQMTEIIVAARAREVERSTLKT